MDAKQLNNAAGASPANDPGERQPVKAFSAEAFPGALTAARWFFCLAAALAAAALPQLFARGQESGHTIGSYSLLWIVLLSFAITLALAELALLGLLLTRASRPLAGLAARVSAFLARLGWLNGGLMVAIWAGFVFLVFYRYQKHFADYASQIWLLWLAAGIGAVALAAWKKLPYSLALLVNTLFYAFGVKALGYLPAISSYPFSLSWSEASRYYYASLPYSRWLYGFQIPLSSLHPTRYLLQSMAFWLPNAGIVFHRFWQVFLWLSLSLLTGLVLARRYRLRSRIVFIAVTVWAALFTLQGPVYYHLLVCVILVLFGFDRRRFWKTLIFVALGSAWAGISRVNWIPVPAFLALTLYLLEKPVCEDAQPGQAWPATWLRYLRQPVIWGIAGAAAAFASQAAYMLVSGHESASDFGTSFTSALLWYRLWPSATFPLGVVPAILLVSAPLLTLISGNWLRDDKDWHILRILGLSSMALVLLVGGLVVSAKIGGGSNIHNMDAFLVLLMVMGASIGLGGFARENGRERKAANLSGASPTNVSSKDTSVSGASPAGAAPAAWRPWPLLLAIVMLPVIWNLDIGDPFARRDMKQAAYDLDKIQSLMHEYAPKGEVLFITQRQLVVFNQVSGVRMAPDYELMTLMEMSIANNQAYLDRFKEDLRSHRFALIVADRQHKDIIDPEVYGFAEENNAWVEYVSQPLLTYYQEKSYFDTQGIQFLVPRK